MSSPSKRPERKARAAGLRYVHDGEEGIRRRRCGRGFTYLRPDGSTLRDDQTRERIERLAIPPGWVDVWICSDSDGHLQATGRDQEDRKQYRYHDRWAEIRDESKFRRILAFGHRLPRIRRHVGRDLAREGLSRLRVLAAAVRILDRTGLRIGNPEYHRRNGSHGLTTLRKKHVSIHRDELELDFVGKGGRKIRLAIRDPRLAEVVQEALEAPGWRLLKYTNQADDRVSLSPDDVNEYIGSAGGGPFTAKDFRTWLASVGVVRLLTQRTASSGDDRKTRWLEAVDEVADRLGNTRTVARESYLPPGLEKLYVEGSFDVVVEELTGRADALRVPGRRRDEPLTLALLQWLLDRDERDVEAGSEDRGHVE